MSKKNTEMDSSSSGEDNLLRQLSNIDFSQPLKVDIIFEDSDDEQESSKVKTEINTNSPSQEHETENYHHARNELSRSHTNIENNSAPPTFDSNTNEGKENLKRKIENEDLNLSKVAKTENSNNNDIIQETQPHLVAYVSNLLKAVSKHLIYILNSYNEYNKKQRQNGAQAEQAFQYFSRVKHHFFNLSFCTVANVILPEIQNRNFLKKFFSDTEIIAAEKNMKIDIRTQLIPLFIELVNWTRNKQVNSNSIDPIQPKKLSACHQQNDNSLLIQQLNEPPKHLSTYNESLPANSYGIAPTQPKKLSASQQQFESSLLMQHLIPPSMQLSTNNESLTANTKMTENHTKPSIPYAIPINGQSGSNVSVAQQPQHSINGSVENINGNINTPCSSTSKSFLFEYGPPGNRITISLDTSSLQSSTAQDSSSHIINNQVSPAYQHFGSQQTLQRQMEMSQNTKSGSKPNAEVQNSGHFTSYPANNNVTNQNQPNKPNQIQNSQQHYQQQVLSHVQDSRYLPLNPAYNNTNVINDQRQYLFSPQYQHHIQQQSLQQAQQNGRGIPPPYPGINTSYSEVGQRQSAISTQYQQQRFQQQVCQNVKTQQRTVTKNDQSSAYLNTYAVPNTSNVASDHNQLSMTLNQQQSFQQQQYQKQMQQQTLSRNMSTHPVKNTQQTRSQIPNNTYMNETLYNQCQGTEKDNSYFYRQDELQTKQLQQQTPSQISNNSCINEKLYNQFQGTEKNNLSFYRQDELQTKEPQQQTPSQIPNNSCINEKLYNQFQGTEKNNLSFYKQDELQTKEPQAQLVQKNQAYQIDPSNAEMTRSESTDSGFMSPLNFSFNETNNNRSENERASTPVITHITSLNPSAVQIAEGNCCVCGNVTRKMCLGCYKKYYCSPYCQRLEWASHQTMCAQKNTS